MTITHFAADYVASDGQHFAEIDGALLSIMRGDGQAIHFHGRKLASDFRTSCERHGAPRTIATYLRIAPYQAMHSGAWMASPYKPGKVPELIRDYFASVRNFASERQAAMMAFDAEFLA